MLISCILPPSEHIFSNFVLYSILKYCIFTDKFGCRGSTNKKSPTTRYRYSRIYPYCVFLFYTPVIPNEALIVKIIKSKVLIVALRIDAFIVILSEQNERENLLITKNMENTLQPLKIESLIYEIRGHKVMLDRDLAKLYGVTTGNLNKAVKRNIERFPERYMFQLTSEENLKFQNGISSWGGTRSLPYVFTEQGVAMLSSVLHSPTAIQISISIIDAFVAIRNHIMHTATFTAELEAIKAKLELLERSDEDNLEAINDLSEDMCREIDTIYQAIAALSVKEPSDSTPRPKIGFKTQNDQ